MTNAEIYLASARVAMARQPQHVNIYVENFKKYLAQKGEEYKSYDHHVDIVLLNVRYQVQQMADAQPMNGWALDDYDSITWFLGMFAKGMSEYLHGDVTFEQIFKDCFNKHFMPYGMD